MLGKVLTKSMGCCWGSAEPFLDTSRIPVQTLVVNSLMNEIYNTLFFKVFTHCGYFLHVSRTYPMCGPSNRQAQCKDNGNRFSRVHHSRPPLIRRQRHGLAHRLPDAHGLPSHGPWACHHFCNLLYDSSNDVGSSNDGRVLLMLGECSDTG